MSEAASSVRGMTDVRPFRLHVPDDQLADLRERLIRTRLLPDSPRRMPSGMTSAWLGRLVETWVDWDWRAREQWLNSFPQFLAEVDGSTVHFAHLRSEAVDAPALLVMHGWPHTFALQLDFAALLPDFHVVVASLPGFAFSPPYADGPADERRFADTMHGLMSEVLGYETYLTYGEDVSANVSDLIAASHPDKVAGIVATHAHFGTPEEREASDGPEVGAFFARLDADHGPHGSYGHVQWARPDTLAARSTTLRRGCSPGSPRSWPNGRMSRRAIRRRSNRSSRVSAS